MSDTYDQAFENFQKRMQNNGNLPKKEAPPSEEYLQYLKTLREDPSRELSLEQRYASIMSKLHRKAIGGKFIPTEKQSKLLNILWSYFNKLENSLDQSKGICLLGTFGSGKTEIMKSFLLTPFKSFNMHSAQKACKITSAIQMIEHYDEEQKFTSYFENDLYIDDLGTEQRAKFMSKNDDPILSKFFELWYLNRENRKLFLSSNLTKAELQAKYGGRVFSRMHHLLNFITFEDKDFRL